MRKLLIIPLLFCGIVYGQNDTQKVSKSIAGSKDRAQINEAIVKTNRHYDSLAVHLDSIQALRVSVNAVGAAVLPTDTAAMLSDYALLSEALLISDTATALAYLNTDIALKLNISDTATMLDYINTDISLRLAIADTAAMLDYINTDITLRLPIADTAAMLTYINTDITNTVAATAINTTSLQDSLGWFIVTSPEYGADKTGVSSAVAAINAAIVAANAEANDRGGVVYVPPGQYSIDDTIEMKSNVTIYIPNRATQFNVSYDGPVFYSEDETLTYFEVDGGEYVGTGSGKWTYNLFEFKYNTNTNAKRNRFTNTTCFYADAGIDISVSSQGWFNDNLFSDNKWQYCKRFLRTREGAGSQGIDGNQFLSQSIQSGDSVNFAIDSLSGSWNTFYGIELWDWSAGPAQIQSIVLSATSSYNIIRGGNLAGDTYFTDLGYENDVKEGGHYYTAISDSLTVWSSDGTKGDNVNKLTVAHRGGAGSAGSPGGDLAFKMKSRTGAAITDVNGANWSTRIVSQNEAAANYSSSMKLQVHGVGSDQAEDSYIDALNLDGSEGGDATFAQNITVPGTATIATIVNTEVQTNTTQLQDSLGWFNVLSYGAIPGDGLSDTAGINSAIRAARDVPAWGNNPTVVIPWGRYNLDGPIIHKASVNIDIAKGALFTFPTGYEGSGILFEDGEININFDIGGGIFFETGAAEYKWSGIKFDKQTSAASYASFGTIHDMTFYYPNRGIDVLIDNGGWINAIAFERNSFIEFKTGIYAPDGGGNSQFRGNIFHANQFQSGDSTNYGIEAIGDEENSFTSNKWWDFDPTTTRMFVINSRQLFSNNMLAGTYDIESPLSEPENDYFPMKIAKGTIVFGDDGVADSIVYLPNSAIVWDVQVRVSTNFNDSGTDLLNVGTSVSGTYFLSSEDVSTGAGTFISVTQNNAPAMMFNNNVITATYNGQNSDSSTGSATIWVRYTER